MKRLIAGSVNTLSFIKLSSFTTNSFDVVLEKIVGDGTLTLSGLTDINNLSTCKDFIQLNIDLLSNAIEGGEYLLTITNDGNEYTYLTNIKSHEYVNSTTNLYKDSVVLTNADSGVNFESEQLKIFTASDLSAAQTAESSVAYGSNISGPSDPHISLDQIINGSGLKMYAYSPLGGEYIFWAGVIPVTNPNGNSNLPFTANIPDPFYVTITLQANTVTEIEVFDVGNLLLASGGLLGATASLQVSITKQAYVKSVNNVTINSNLASEAVRVQPSWANATNYRTSQYGASIAMFVQMIDDDL